MLRGRVCRIAFGDVVAAIVGAVGADYFYADCLADLRFAEEAAGISLESARVVAAAVVGGSAAEQAPQSARGRIAAQRMCCGGVSLRVYLLRRVPKSGERQRSSHKKEHDKGHRNFQNGVRLFRRVQRCLAYKPQAPVQTLSVVGQ